MHVEHLLHDASLGLRPLWAEDALLRREITGVTVTDLEDPARFVRPGEVVLSGLVWWSADGGRDKAERFVAALKDAGAAALLAGEETHGSVPEDLVEACVRHGVPVAGVPAQVMFRAITDTVYLWQWGGLSRHHVLPEHVRGRLDRLVTQDADPALVLTTAFAHLGGITAYLLTSTGRTVAATPDAPPLAARAAAALPGSDTGVTLPVDDGAAGSHERWWLHLPEPAAAPPRLPHEIAAVLGRCQEALASRRAAERRTADALGRLLTAADAEPAALESAARACGLAFGEPYRVVVAGTGARHEHLAQGALAEVVAHTAPASAAVGRLPDGTAFAVVPEAAAGALAACWPLVAACEPEVLLHGGLASRAADVSRLPGALGEARYALASARATRPDTSSLTDATTLTALDTLLTGIPAEVRTAYSRTVLGALLDTGKKSAASLLHTLEVFLVHDGSWARTAEVLRLHVNTVHYRVQRIEHFTGRDLSSLRDRLDLWAALLCRADPGAPVTVSARH
ncbi:helix-turn-helix domain-containing protein [Streptomyces sp. NPDC047017]|uniref:helix-turn-helix domain-containing protein n=1 Tax=Streptomyces sp. NPDC047017 TaxID=3155024 RepID=UPI0033D790C1